MAFLGAYFIVNGTYNPCIKTTLSTAPPFRRIIEFIVEDLNDKALDLAKQAYERA
jgi:hypothetical protein